MSLPESRTRWGRSRQFPLELGWLLFTEDGALLLGLLLAAVGAVVVL